MCGSTHPSFSAPAAHTDGVAATEATTEAVIEPHRPTFFTATGAAKKDDASNVRKLGSHALGLKIKHVEMLIERGGSNADHMTSDVVKMKRDLKLMTSKAEAELKGIRYLWSINGKEYRGRTIGEYRRVYHLIIVQCCSPCAFYQARSSSSWAPQRLS